MVKFDDQLVSSRGYRDLVCQGRVMSEPFSVSKPSEGRIEYIRSVPVSRLSRSTLPSSTFSTSHWATPPPVALISAGVWIMS